MTISLLLVSGKGPYSAAIRLAQRLKGYARPDITHIALLVDGARPVVIESVSRGVVMTPLKRWQRTAATHFIVPLDAAPRDHAEMAAYLIHQADVHTRYDWFSILTIGLHLVTGGTLSLSLDDGQICSALAASCLTRRGDIFENPNTVMPAQIAQIER